MRCITCFVVTSTSNANKRRCWQDKQQCRKCYYGDKAKILVSKAGKSTARRWMELQELERNLKEYVSIMATEPEGYIKLSEVYHHLRRMLGDE